MTPLGLKAAEQEGSMRWVGIIIGVLMVLAGVVWTLQGFNILRGSFMSGHTMYAVLGLVVGVLGLLLVGLSLRRRATAS
jgi:hypothetical protein